MGPEEKAVSGVRPARGIKWVSDRCSTRIWETFRPCAVWRCAYRRAYWRAYWWRMVLRVRTLSSGVPARYLQGIYTAISKLSTDYLETIYKLSPTYQQATDMLSSNHPDAVCTQPASYISAEGLGKGARVWRTRSEEGGSICKLPTSYLQAICKLDYLQAT
eukprot:2674171-Rhodomonas_salina.1